MHVNVLIVNTHNMPPFIFHAPDPLSIRIKERRPLRDAEGGRVVPGVLVVEVRGVEEVKTLQGALHRQTEAG